MDIATLVVAGLIIAAVILFLLRDKMRGRSVPEQLRPGQALPDFTALDEAGHAVSSADLRGAPAVLLFVRGTWCPFCSKQVANLTSVYKDIIGAGARLVLVTPQPLETTRRVAELFEVDFEFWLDGELAASELLGLVLEAGVPDDHQNTYGKDTLWPAALVVDADGIIRFSELSRFIADRPNPDKLLNVVRQL